MNLVFFLVCSVSLSVFIVSHATVVQLQAKDHAADGAVRHQSGDSKVDLAVALKEDASSAKKHKKKRKKEPVLCSLKDKGGWLSYCNTMQSSYMPKFAKKLHWCSKCLEEEEEAEELAKKEKDVRHLRADTKTTIGQNRNQQKLLSEDIRKKGTDSMPVKPLSDTSISSVPISPTLGSTNPDSRTGKAADNADNAANVSDGGGGSGITVLEETIVVMPVESLCRQSPVGT